MENGNGIGRKANMSVLSDRDLQIFRDREKRELQREKENQEGTYEHYQKFMQSDEVKEHRRQLLREMSEKLLGAKNG